MATVNKNFRIKNGLVVEGSTATVNGQNILTETGGDNYILNLIGGETLVKSVSSDFTVTGGGELQINGSSDLLRTADIAGKQDTLTAGSGIDIDGSNNISVDPFDLIGSGDIGKIDLDVKSGKLVIDKGVLHNYTDTLYDALGAASTAQSNAEDYADGLATNYDAAGAASTAESNANTYTDNAINALDTDDIEEGAANLYFTNTRARSAMQAGSGLNYDSSKGEFSVNTSIIADQTYVDTAISNLIDGAPSLLNTLNEIAAAINDDANYFTTIANQIAGKQDTLTAGSNISITSNTISVTGLDTDDVSEGSNLYFTDARARSAVDGTNRSFTSLEINQVSKEVAATTGNIATAAATTAYAWPKADYRSAKFMVKVKNGSHTEVSELLVTLDTSDSVYLTEYGMSSTSGTSLGTITADVSGTDVRIRVTPANNNSEVLVAGTLIK